ncbi:MAG: hypothetical protein HW374_1720, partial [Bacteroidetes bacterium]|nr:hypothetical protein [Bacteroidota bacterium]
LKIRAQEEAKRWREKRELEERIVESEERYRMLVETSSECICNLDLEGKFLFMNTAGLEMHGMSESEVTGLHCTEFAKPEYRPLFNEMLEKARNGGRVRFEFEGDTVSIVHVYANYPTYKWVEAKETGTEGIACVDDAARAAVVYLRHFELTKDRTSLDRAKSLLRFILHMQADDGTFYNFIYSDHSINRTGETSRSLFGWWAARSIWSFGLGYRILQYEEPAFAEHLQNSLHKSFRHIDTLLTRYGQTKSYGRFESPRWLLYEEASDATTEIVLGLLEYYEATKDSTVRNYILRLAEGVTMMQDGDFDVFPYGLHRSWRTMWHMWGNSQTQVLAQAGKLLKNAAFVQSAEREARSFYARLLINGFMKELDVAAPEKKVTYEQIAYGVRPMALGLIRLYEATRKNEYLKMAGLAASWLFGNNVLRQQMYDPATGRCFDGISDSITVNKNSGAESTIEALYTVLEIEQYPVARQYLGYLKIRSGSLRQYEFAVFLGEGSKEITVALDLKEGRILVLEGEEGKRFQKNLK